MTGKTKKSRAGKMGALRRKGLGKRAAARIAGVKAKRRK